LRRIRGLLARATSGRRRAMSSVMKSRRFNERIDALSQTRP
jgi:hypothetical protein